jgi:hypothetical protein
MVIIWSLSKEIAYWPFWKVRQWSFNRYQAASLTFEILTQTKGNEFVRCDYSFEWFEKAEVTKDKLDSGVIIGANASSAS